MSKGDKIKTESNGTHVLEMSAFEKSLVAKEKADRAKATTNYVRGIQGRDGGACYAEYRPSSAKK